MLTIRRHRHSIFPFKHWPTRDISTFFFFFLTIVWIFYFIYLCQAWKGVFFFLNKDYLLRSSIFITQWKNYLIFQLIFIIDETCKRSFILRYILLSIVKFQNRSSWWNLNFHWNISMIHILNNINTPGEIVHYPWSLFIKFLIFSPLNTVESYICLYLL